MALARVHHERGWGAWALKLLGTIYAHEPAKAEEAEQAYRQALTVATELGMRPLVVQCHIGLGSLHARAGRREAMREYLAIAATLCREMGMQFWLQQTELSLSGPP